MNEPRRARCPAVSGGSRRKRLPGNQRRERRSEGPRRGTQRRSPPTSAGERARRQPGGSAPGPAPRRAPNLRVHVGQAVPAELVEEPLALEVVHDHGHELRVPRAGPRAARPARAGAGPRAGRRRRGLRLRRGRRRRGRRRLRLRVGGHDGRGRRGREPGRAGAPGRRRLHQSRHLREANGMLLRNQRIPSDPGSEREPGEKEEKAVTIATEDQRRNPPGASSGRSPRRRTREARWCPRRWREGRAGRAGRGAARRCRPAFDACDSRGPRAHWDLARSRPARGCETLARCHRSR